MSDDKELFHKICGRVRGDSYATLNDLVYAIIDTVDAARAQGGEAVAVGRITCEDPDFYYGEGRYVLKAEFTEWLDKGTKLYIHPAPSVPEPFGTESAYQAAKSRPAGSNMLVSCNLVTELVEALRPNPPAEGAE